MPTVMSPGKAWTEVAEWEEPRHSGPFDAATLPHFIPLSNTFPHFPGRKRLLKALLDANLPFQSGIQWVLMVGARPKKRANGPASAYLGAILRPFRWVACPLAAQTGRSWPLESSSAAASAAATSSRTDGTSISATTSWIFGPARAASS